MKQKIIFTTVLILICFSLSIVFSENVLGRIICNEECTRYEPECGVVNGVYTCWAVCVEKKCIDEEPGTPVKDPDSSSPEKNSGWECDISKGTCYYHKSDGTYRQESTCLAICKSCKVCKNKRCQTVYCSVAQRYDGPCSTDKDCQNGTPSSVSCNVCVGEKCQSGTFNVSSCSQVTGYTLCSSDSQCKTSTTPTSSIRCNVCIGEKCQSRTFNLSSCSRITNYTRCSSDQDCKGTPPPPPPPPSPTCSINKFELPNHVWTGVDYEAKWSTNSDCKWGEITCKLGDKDCRDNETLSGNVTVGSINHEKSFQIKTPGVYTYQLKACYDKNNEDTCDIWEDTLGTGLDYIEVQAVNLPWWQEIIPVLPDKLQGFLRGLIS